MNSVVNRGDVIMFMSDIIKIIVFKVFEILVIKVWSLVLLFCWWIFVNIGIKVCVNVFLEKRWCRKLGILLVKKNIFVVVLFFIRWVIIIFFVNLRICDNSVIMLIISFDLINFWDIYVVFFW